MGMSAWINRNEWLTCINMKRKMQNAVKDDNTYYMFVLK